MQRSGDPGGQDFGGPRSVVRCTSVSYLSISVILRVLYFFFLEKGALISKSFLAFSLY